MKNMLQILILSTVMLQGPMALAQGVLHYPYVLTLTVPQNSKPYNVQVLLIRDNSICDPRLQGNNPLNPGHYECEFGTKVEMEGFMIGFEEGCQLTGGEVLQGNSSHCSNAPISQLAPLNGPQTAVVTLPVLQ